MHMNTKEKGDLAVGHAINYFMSSGYEVCLPIGDKKSWDIVIEKDGKLSTVQVKFAGKYKRNDKCRAGLRVTGGNQSYLTAKKYSDKEFDILFIYSEKGERFNIPWEDVSVRSELTVDDDKYQKFKV